MSFYSNNCCQNSSIFQTFKVATVETQQISTLDPVLTVQRCILQRAFSPTLTISLTLTLTLAIVERKCED